MPRKFQPNEVKKMTSGVLKERIRILKPREDNPMYGIVCEYINEYDSDHKVAQDIGATIDYVRNTRRQLYGYFPSEIVSKELREIRKREQEEHKKNSPQFQMLAEMDFRNQMIAEIRQDMERRFAYLSGEFYQNVMADIKGHLENEMNRRFAQLRESSDLGEKVVKLRRGLPKELKGGA